MSFLGKLFGDSEVVKTGSEMIEKSFYTDQEKADRWSKFLEQYEAFKIAQRWLMLIVCPMYVIMSAILFSFEMYSEINNRAWDFTLAYNVLNGAIGTSFITIVIFYFGGGALEGVVNRFKSKK